MNLPTLKIDHYNDDPFAAYNASVPVQEKIDAFALREEFVKQNNCWLQLGSGSYGTVFATPNPALVLKVSYTHNKLSSDGYHSYLKVVLNKNNSNNPFLPKVDKFVRFVTNDKDSPGIVFGVRMEKLHPLCDLNSKDLIAMGNALIDNFEDHEYFKNRDYTGAIAYSIKKNYNNDNYDAFKDQALIAALQSIKKVQNESGTYNDMSVNNFMVRFIKNLETGKTVYQLVITDPLS